MKILINSDLTQEEKQRIFNHFPEHEFIDEKFTQENINQADIIIGNPSLSFDLNQPHLKALLLNSAGSDSYCQEGVLNEKTVLCNASGSYGKCIGEYVVGMMIYVSKQFRHFTTLRNQNTWGKRIGGKEIFNSRVLIVGYGDIGNECAKRLKGFDCTIVGIKRRMIDLPEYLDELYTMESLDEQLKLADYVILCLPNSRATYHIMNKERLMMMKRDAVLINVGRGNAIDHQALVEVLNTGHLFGVGLDVTEEEPLPSTHPLWNFENVMITPHMSGSFTWKSVREFFIDLTIRNIQHIQNNEPLENTVDRTTGYRYQTVYRK